MNKKYLPILCGVALFSVFAACSSHSNSQTAENHAVNEQVIPGKALVVEESAQETVSVVDINYDERLITIKNAADEISTVYVPEMVTSFTEISQGDSIMLDLYQGVAFSLNDGSGLISDNGVIDDVIDIHVKSADGKKPAVLDAQIEQVVAEIVLIDYEKRMVTLFTEDGRNLSVHVNEAVKEFENLKEGQKIDITYAVSFALDIKKV